ncbi:MAG: GAP family protein [Solirubrobacterales bacterium]
MDFASVLPLAFVMIAGPQIISAFFFATSDSWKRTSAAYVLGASVSITAVVTVAYLLAKGITSTGEEGESGPSTIDYVIVGLLVLAMVNQFRGRRKAEPPKWMGKLQGATPKLALTLGFLLLGFFPSDLVTSVTVGGHLANHGNPWVDAVPFIAFTLLLLALPALFVALLGQRAQTQLPKARDWMNDNSWIVSEIVIVFFIAIILAG